MAFNLLQGVRGEAPVDFDALADVLQRFSQLAEERTEIAEIEINPLLVFPQAATSALSTRAYGLAGKREKGLEGMVRRD